MKQKIHLNWTQKLSFSFMIDGLWFSKEGPDFQNDFFLQRKIHDCAGFCLFNRFLPIKEQIIVAFSPWRGICVKVSKFRVCLDGIFSYLDWIPKFTRYIFLLSPTEGKLGPGRTANSDAFQAVLSYHCFFTSYLQWKRYRESQGWKSRHYSTAWNFI